MMTSGLVVLFFLLAVTAAGVMGFAIQRGATCLVVAIHEIVWTRRASRLLALIEASAIVAGGLLIARLSGHLTMQPLDYTVTGWTFLGGLLIGLGAFVAGSCIVGAVARLGSGEWAYVLVPAGFYLGTFITAPLLGSAAPVATGFDSPIIAHALALIGPFLLFALWRVWRSAAHVRRGTFAAYAWSPHVATAVIGLSFLLILLTVGEWSYANLLTQAAHGMVDGIGGPVLLFIALFSGALIGGWSAGCLSRSPPSARAMIRCLTGGALMGAGGTLIPGSNDGLLLLGLPLAHAHAWVAMITMGLTISGAMIIQRRWIQHAA